MSIDLDLAPKQKRASGEPCCEPVVYPDVERHEAERMAAIAKVCVCELVPLFELSQPTVSHHLKVLREAGIVDSERRGLWAFYYVIPEALDEFAGWLS
jgi:ArsR family transcriptional regulator